MNTLYDLALLLIGEVPVQFTWIYGVFMLLFIVALVVICLFPIVFIFKMFD